MNFSAFKCIICEFFFIHLLFLNLSHVIVMFEKYMMYYYLNITFYISATPQLIEQ